MRKQEQKGKITALYERLSHDDGRSDESVSVENQKRILEDYARKNGFTNVRHFTDAAVIIGLKTIRLKKFQKHGAF